VKYFIANIFFLFLVTQSVFSRNLDAPVVTCLEVHEAGDVTIYWQSLDLTAIEFRIFYSTDNANWIQAGSVDTQNSSLSFHHTLAQANDQIYYYYIAAFYPGGEEVTSGVFRTIFLVVDNSTDGVATLLWNSVRDPLPEGSSNYYKIYKSIYENGVPATWDLITDDFENTLYNYEIPNGLCLDSINFKIEIDNSYGCSSVSNITGNWFSEIIQPDEPVFDTISISNNSNVILGWESSTSEDAAGTLIYIYDGVWIVIDTIFGNDITFYTDSSYSPCDQNFQYAIAAFDSCGIISPGSFDTPLRPIFLYDISFNICSGTNTLTWEPYINATPSIGKYEIWVSEDNGVPTLIDEVTANDNLYNHSGVENSTEYVYFVRAVFGNFTSTSCKKTIVTGNFIKPDNLYFANATVLTDNNIELTLDLDLNPVTCTWELFRSDAGSTSQTLLTSFQRNQVSSSPFNYLDETADGSTGYYTYSVNVFDSCGALTIESNTVKSIFLEGEHISDNENYLTWNAFEGWDAGVGKYYIFRILGDVIPTLPIDSTDSQTTEYTDNTSSVSASESKFSYWVQAAEESPNNFGYQEKSNSNIIDLFRETELYFPNAFRPGGTTNNEFKPVMSGFGGSNYLFQIYNRWGQLFFESTDPNTGWDGTYKGNLVPMGTYVYRLVYQDVYSITKQQQGTVMLIE